MKKIFVVDNYDSFTYNLVHYLEDLGVEVIVQRNDVLDFEQVERCDGIVLSPGPGVPEQADALKETIKRFQDSKPILGVCLGHQAIAEVFGGKLKNLEQVYHGVTGELSLTNEEPIYNALSTKPVVGRYHSWVAEKPLPAQLQITSEDENGEVMSFRHTTKNIVGVQFHPESILTPEGKSILQNWITYYVNK